MSVIWLMNLRVQKKREMNIWAALGISVLE